MDNEYSRNLIKGKITETIFEEMFRTSNEFTILPMGYEHTIPELAQYQNQILVKQVLENIRNAPDFILISQDKTRVFLVEVKFRNHINTEEIHEIANHTLEKWNPAFLFVATYDNFYFDSCTEILNNLGSISPLKSNWIADKIQERFITLLNEFIK